MNQLPYKVYTPNEAVPDYTNSRRYHSILRGMSLLLHSDRHQLLFTDDTQKTSDILTSYALHTDSLKDGKLSPLEKAIIGVSLSSEEVATSPQLYVNRETGQSEEPCIEPGKGDGVNQKRFDPRVFTEVVRFDFGSPLYKEWAKRMWDEQVRFKYEWVDKDKRDIWLFTEWDIAPTLLKYFESDHNRMLFVNEVQAPKTEEEKQVLLRGLQKGLYREKRYGFDHRDYVQRIPNVVWVVPFDLCAEFEYQYTIKSGIEIYEFPNTNFLLHVPFNEWLSNLSGRFSAVDEKRRKEGYTMSMTDYIQSRLEDVLKTLSNGLKRIKQERKLDGQQLLEFLGLTSKELVYLERFQSQDR